MLLDWSDEFDRWLDRIEASADNGDPKATRIHDVVAGQLKLLPPCG